MTAPKVIFGFEGLQQYPISVGIKQLHAGEPTEGDKNLYVLYGQRRLDAEL
ncbi:MAG: hypothetical protein JWN95_738 [Frankiales bacterium]|nr:hypothetical protein [Frankiales bacterium]